MSVKGKMMMNKKNLNLAKQGLNQGRVTQVIEDCILNEEKVLRGKDYWATRNDPFAIWEKNA